LPEVCSRCGFLWFYLQVLKFCSKVLIVFLTVVLNCLSFRVTQFGYIAGVPISFEFTVTCRLFGLRPPVSWFDLFSHCQLCPPYTFERAFQSK
jgi:hypothetical protein